jgi:hypothetical protein
MYPLQGRSARAASQIAGRLRRNAIQQQVLDQERRDGKHNCRQAESVDARGTKAMSAIGLIQGTAEWSDLQMPKLQGTARMEWGGGGAAPNAITYGLPACQRAA